MIPRFAFLVIFIFGLTKVPFGEYFFSRVLKQIQGYVLINALVFLLRKFLNC